MKLGQCAERRVLRSRRLIDLVPIELLPWTSQQGDLGLLAMWPRAQAVWLFENSDSDQRTAAAYHVWLDLFQGTSIGCVALQELCR